MEFRQKKIRAGFNPITSSGGTTTLTNASVQYQLVSGALTHSIKLPNATTMLQGLAFNMINSSTGALTILLNDNSTLTTLASGQGAFFILTNNGSTNGTWRIKTGISGKAGGIGSSAPGATISTAARALYWAGLNGSESNVIDFTLFATKANAAAFGTLLVARAFPGSCSSQTKSVIAGGAVSSSFLTSMETVQIATQANATAFGGILTQGRGNLTALADKTRGAWGGGGLAGPASSNVIDYVTIAVGANAASFGTLTARSALAACASPTRGLFVGGDTTTAGSPTTLIDSIVIQSTGNAASWGALQVNKYSMGACSNSTRGLVAGGYNGSVNTQNIESITLSVGSTASNFSTLVATRTVIAAAAAQVNAQFAGGTNGSPIQSIEDVRFADLSSAQTWGNLTQARSHLSGCSSAHGGLF